MSNREPFWHALVLPPLVVFCFVYLMLAGIVVGIAMRIESAKAR